MRFLLARCNQLLVRQQHYIVDGCHWSLSSRHYSKQGCVCVCVVCVRRESESVCVRERE